MATINFATREITAKIVYYGPRSAGCNTNVERLYQLVSHQRKGQLHMFGQRESGERSWYFDYQCAPGSEPSGAVVEGFTSAWQIYSLPGGIDLAAHREEVLRDADAVVFVADARIDRAAENLDTMLALEGLLATLGVELAAMPIVIQVNHTDAADAQPAAQVAFDLNPYGFPVVSAVARDGTGVMDTHHAIAASVLARARDSLAGGETSLTLTAIHEAERVGEAEVIRRHVQAIHERSSITPSMEQVSHDTRPDPIDEGQEVEVPFQPRDFAGHHPVDVLDATVDGDRIRLRLVMERMGGGETRQLTVVLANRPTDTPPMLRHSPSSPPVQQPTNTDRVFDYLPEPDEVEDLEVVNADLPGVWYGILGVAGGLVIGMLLAYLIGAVT